jgi:predicted adenylyl cyclase CyaB
MSIEIEAKLKVDSLQEIEKRLERLNAEFVEEQYQSDTHFDDADDTLMNSDSCLRLRHQKANDKTKYFITFKGAKEQSSYKKRIEIETSISDGDSMEKLLIALGYKKKMLIEKKRRLYKYGGCEVALDHLKLLGDFVEIEGPGEKEINEVQKSLGLENVNHIPKSYAGLIAEKLSCDEGLDTEHS